MNGMDPFENAQSFLEVVRQWIDKEDHIYLDRLLQPQAVHVTELEITTDSGNGKDAGKNKGKKQRFAAYRSQHNNALGPYKGGIRFHPQVSESEVKALSLWMSLKCSVAGLPYGGGKGGVVVDPMALSKKELEALSRAYARFLSPHIGQDKDVPAPDVNTNGQIMAWMLDEYEHVTEKQEPGAFTGKPLELGGSQGRTQATGLGGVIALKQLIEALKKMHPDTKEAWFHKPVSQITIAVQGFGNVGFYFAKIASELGFKVVAVSDSKGATYVEDGLDPVATMNCKMEKGQLSGCYCAGGVCDLRKGKMIDNEALLELPVDVLVPSALENVIHAKNAAKIQAQCVIEMANGPVTPEADTILNKKKIVVVPDILANSGGVTVSYLEWVQNRAGWYWTEDEVLAKLDDFMNAAFARVMETFQSMDVSLRQAAYVLAVRRIIEAEKLRRP